MPPKMPKIDCDVEQYLQFHNRLASFVDWNLDWELNGDKPSPEDLARAGFFSWTKPPYDPDNVMCPYCRLALDNWDPKDDPQREHKLRSRHCDFVRDRQKVRDMGKDAGGPPPTSTPNGPGKKQNGTSDTGTRRPARARQERAVGASSKANGGEAGLAQRRRPGRPRKQPASG
ncbi:hypothetical protein DHEL01_v202470 [Diaporthe helianthi]|uniref:Uncharacterized protein n=1 Tax=Diaporthe helianthi TaxID=158607 RepID=A0A2P5I9H1_DIAHE|nr:hypothetical protein DHEL01_v202470 [Diaporthe helianthi]